MTIQFFIGMTIIFVGVYLYSNSPKCFEGQFFSRSWTKPHKTTIVVRALILAATLLSVNILRSSLVMFGESEHLDQVDFQQGFLPISTKSTREQQKVDVEYTWQRNFSCAERLYLEQNKSFTDVISLSELPFNDAAFLRQLSIELRKNRAHELLPGQKHYIESGYRSGQYFYHCTPECHSLDCLSCDKEQEYLEKYPDVKAGLLNGEQHFKQYGYYEGRVWSCGTFRDSSEGTEEGCRSVFSTFVNDTQQIVSKWPVFGNFDFHMSPPPQCNALLLIDARDHPWLDYVLRVHRHFLGSQWMFYLVAPKPVADLWRQRYHGPMINAIDLPEEFSDLSIALNRRRLFLSNFLWRDTIPCENIFFTQTDVIQFRDGVEEFLEYDYVGSPMFPESFPALEWRILAAYQDTWGGCGGLSIRKRSVLLHAIENCPISRKDAPDDAWISACVMLNNGKLPSPMVANRFSVGTRCEIDAPLGGHKMWDWCKTSSCANSILSSRLHKDIYGEANAERNCKEGSILYLSLYADVRLHIERGSISSAWDHYNRFGRKEKRVWRCLRHQINVGINIR